jgi:hypothetical protein
MARRSSGGRSGRSQRTGPYQNLSPSSFVYPPGSQLGGSRGLYPINTRARARNALSRAAQPQTRGSYAAVERAVNRKWPSIGTRHHEPR